MASGCRVGATLLALPSLPRPSGADNKHVLPGLCACWDLQVKRTHFHDFMLEVHTKLRDYKCDRDPLLRVADSISKVHAPACPCPVCVSGACACVCACVCVCNACAGMLVVNTPSMSTHRLLVQRHFLARGKPQRLCSPTL